MDGTPVSKKALQVDNVSGTTQRASSGGGGGGATKSMISGQEVQRGGGAIRIVHGCGRREHRVVEGQDGSVWGGVDSCAYP